MIPFKICKYQQKCIPKFKLDKKKFLWRYVIRQVTYEIGILVDANGTNDTSADYDNGNSTSAEM